jgi:hypothetical protein
MERVVSGSHPQAISKDASRDRCLFSLFLVEWKQVLQGYTTKCIVVRTWYDKRIGREISPWTSVRAISDVAMSPCWGSADRACSVPTVPRAAEKIECLAKRMKARRDEVKSYSFKSRKVIRNVRSTKHSGIGTEFS